jgi:hypothetical protein
MDSPDIATPVSPAPAYRPPRQAPAPAPAPIRPAKPSGGSRFFRFIGVLFLVAILAAIIAIAVLALTDAGENDLGRFISDEINEQIDNLKQLVQDNLQ